MYIAMTAGSHLEVMTLCIVEFYLHNNLFKRLDISICNPVEEIEPSHASVTKNLHQALHGI